MSEEITNEVTETTEAPKVEAKKPAVKKPAAKKAAAKKAPAKKAPEKIETESSETTMVTIAEDQLDATAETIISALSALDKQLQEAREVGSDRAKAIIDGFGGENKITELISKLAGYMGEAAGAGMVAGMAPMVVMAGAAKGVYKKITD